jgi:hypothetical protein
MTVPTAAYICRRVPAHTQRDTDCQHRLVHISVNSRTRLALQCLTFYQSVSDHKPNKNVRTLGIPTILISRRVSGEEKPSSGIKQNIDNATVTGHKGKLCRSNNSPPFTVLNNSLPSVLTRMANVVCPNSSARCDTPKQATKTKKF